MRAVKTGLHLSCAFREDGARVLVVLDSLTRYAEALRDQAIAIGEALGPGGWPIRLGQSLAQLLEQIGTTQQGSSAALISVLLQGEDIEEPLADTVRGLLDGHILLDRAEAERGAFPAIDFLRSVSRSAEHLNDTPVLSLCEATRATLSEARRLRPLYDAGLITPGANPDADAAVQRAELLSTCLRGSSAHIEAARKALSQVLGHPS
jgi:flagellum-specific ATP synthase